MNLVEPEDLREYFQLLINIYEPNPIGRFLVEWLKDDWHLFTHPRMDLANAKELLSEILNDGDIVQKPFAPSPSYRSEALIRWETLREELLYKNRFFLDEALDTDRLTELLGHLPADDLPKKWYRARIQAGADPFLIGAMGAPPKRLASYGRANPAGIPYLYLGSTQETAASEIRPHTGEIVCIADFAISGTINVVDLRNPRYVVSPFLLLDEGAIGQLRADINFLEKLGNELTQPVLPQGAAIDYLPSQYLCEFIKKSDYDGVIYRSSVSNGINLALFDPTKAIGGSVQQFSVSRVLVEVAAI